MTEPTPPLILASTSPRRRALLAQLGIPCEVRPSSVDETRRAGEPAGAYVRRLARAKASACALPGRLVLGADTIVVVDGEVLGKPVDEADARRMLARLSARSHEVMTAVALAARGSLDDRLSVTRVRMRTIAAEEIAQYCASGESTDKAGAYAIQGRAAAFVEHIEGSYTGVVGLPLFETLALLAAAGYDHG